MLKNTYLLKVSWVVLKFLNERNLIENRIGKYFEDNDRLCGKHREIYGKFWRQPKQCFHPNHLKPSNGQKSCKVLTASFHQVMELSKFHKEFSVAKLAWKSVNCADWPKFLPMEFRAPIRTRGGNQEALLQIQSCVENTFGSYAPKVFNNLPQEVRKCEQYKVFIKKTKTFLFDKAMARSLL